MTRKTLNDKDKQVLHMANRYVMSQLFDRKWPSEMGAIQWRRYHEAASLALAAYPRRKPKKRKDK